MSAGQPESCCPSSPTAQVVPTTHLPGPHAGHSCSQCSLEEFPQSVTCTITFGKSTQHEDGAWLKSPLPDGAHDSDRWLGDGIILRFIHCALLAGH